VVVGLVEVVVVFGGVVVVVCVVVGGVVVVVVCVVVEVVVCCVAVEVVACLHCVAASWLTVLAPASRSCRRVRLIVLGRLATCCTNPRAAERAARQCPAERPAETWFSWLLSVLA
jgi:hypothetical protein